MSTSEQPKLSAAIMTYNALGTIQRCIESLSFCDEIVVVDDCSTDGTWEFLNQRPGIIKVQRAHVTFADQRTFARDLATGEWLLTMDADEYITEQLARRIREVIDDDRWDGYYLRHRTPYPRGLEGVYWSWHPRLIRRERCVWEQTDNPHSPLNKKGLHLRRLKGGHMEHEPIRDPATAYRKSLNRSVILSAQLRAKGRRGSVPRLILSTVARFFKLYLRGGAWRYGRHGFVWATMAAFEAYSKYALLIADPNTPASTLLDGGPGSYPAQDRITGAKKDAEGSSSHSP